MEREPSIAFIGDLTVDHYVEKNEVRLGGAALNMAIWAKRKGADVSVVTAVGDDEAGKKQLAMLQKKSIDGTHVQILQGSTSSIDIYINDSGDRRYGSWDPGALSDYHMRKEDVHFLKRMDAVCVTIYPQFAHVLSEISLLKHSKKSPYIVMNFGDLREFHQDLRVVEDVLSIADLCVFGLDKDADEKLVNELRDMAKNGHTDMLITFGSFGSLLYESKKTYVEPAKQVNVVDTTGAGDSFLAGFIVQYLKTHDVQKSLAAGALLASKVIQKVGAY